MTSVEQRPEDLEGKSRSIPWIGLVGLILAAVAIFGSVAVAIRLIDDEKKHDQLAVKLKDIEDLQPLMDLQFANLNQNLNSLLLRVQMMRDQPSFKDKDGKVRAELCTRSDGTSGLRLIDKNGTARAFLGTDANGTPFLTLFDKNGTMRAILGVTATPAFLFNEAGRTPEGALTIFDAKGKIS